METSRLGQVGPWEKGGTKVRSPLKIKNKLTCVWAETWSHQCRRSRWVTHTSRWPPRRCCEQKRVFVVSGKWRKAAPSVCVEAHSGGRHDSGVWECHGLNGTQTNGGITFSERDTREIGRLNGRRRGLQCHLAMEDRTPTLITPPPPLAAGNREKVSTQQSVYC